MGQAHRYEFSGTHDNQGPPQPAGWGGRRHVRGSDMAVSRLFPCPENLLATMEPPLASESDSCKEVFPPFCFTRTNAKLPYQASRSTYNALEARQAGGSRNLTFGESHASLIKILIRGDHKPGHAWKRLAPQTRPRALRAPPRPTHANHFGEHQRWRDKYGASP